MILRQQINNLNRVLGAMIHIEYFQHYLKLSRLFPSKQYPRAVTERSKEIKGNNKGKWGDF